MLALGFVIFASFLTIPGIDATPSMQGDPSAKIYSDLLVRIERLEQRDKQHTAKISALESNMAAMSEVVNEQEREINHLKSQLSINQDAADQTQDKTDTGSADNSTGTTTRRLDVATERTGAPNNPIRAVRNDGGARKALRASYDGKVAFFARIEQRNVTSLGVNENIVFEGVLLNKGIGYDPQRGIFTPPTSGVYMFSYSVLPTSDHLWAHLAVNGHTQSHVYARGSGSQTVILSLQKGDDVTVQNEADDETIYGDGYSTFSGLLLWPTLPSGVIVG